MKAKRTISLIAAMALTIAALFASSMPQELYHNTDKEYIETTLLCQSAGVLGPSTATPVTGEELMLALDRIDPEKLSQKQLDIFQELYQSLDFTWEEPHVTFYTDVSPQVFLTDRYEGSFSRKDFYPIEYKDERPAVDIGTVATFGDNIVLEGAYPMINIALKNDGVYLTSFDWLINYRNDKINFFGGGDKLYMNRDQLPDNANGSLGNEYINLAIGRMKHSMGSGYTGNLVISDNFRYQEVAKLTFIGNWLTYNISLTHFDQQIAKDKFQYPAFGGMHQSRVVHRLDMNIANKARFVVNLGTLYQADSAFDIRFFTPFIISHHYYNNLEKTTLNNEPNSMTRDEANNIMSLELEVTPIKNLKLTMQGVLDQFQLANEAQNTVPMALGALANISYAFYLEEHRLSFWTEGAYTMPFLYLNFKNDIAEKICPNCMIELQGKKCPICNTEVPDKYIPNYNYDFILGYNRRDNWNTQLNDLAYSGYPAGPDTIAAALGFDYMSYEIKLNVSGYVKYQIRGEQGLNTESFESSISMETPSGVPERTFIANLSAKWQALPSLEAFGGAQYTHIDNFENTEGETLEKLQGYLGFTWRYSSDK